MERPKYPSTQRPNLAIGGAKGASLGCLGIWVFAYFLVFSIGCTAGHPTTYPVTGEVLYDGQPVEGASVVFTSDGPPAHGTTDAQGKFTLRTFAAGDGATLGEHRVTITKNVAQPSAPDDPYPVTKNVLPAKYAKPDTSNLTANVTTDGDNTFRFELKD